MVKILRTLFISLLPVLLFCAGAFAQVTSGQKAPDFKANDINGKAVSFSDYRGKYVVLEWFNLDCPFVRKHYNSGNMQYLQKTYTDKGVVWLSICSSAAGNQGHYSAEEMGAMMKEKGSAASAVILDENGAIGHKYDAKTTPHMFVMDPEGAIIYHGAIDSIPSTDPMDIEASKNYVEEALNSAMEGKPVETAATKSYGCSVKY